MVYYALHTTPHMVYKGEIMKHYQTESSVSDLIESAFEKIKTIVDTGTIVGEKLETSDGTVIIPISKVTVGYVVGGGEYADLSARRVANHYPLSGGSGGGMSVTPVGFLIESEGKYSFINVENKDLYQTVLNMFNAFLAEIQRKDKEKDEASKK